MKIQEKLYRINKIMTRVAVLIGAASAIVLLVSGFLYQRALNRYGYTQGDLGNLLSLLYKDGTEIRDIFLLTDAQKLDKCIAIADSLMEMKIKMGNTVSGALSVGEFAVIALFVSAVFIGVRKVQKSSQKIGSELSGSLEQLAVAAKLIY